MTDPFNLLQQAKVLLSLGRYTDAEKKLYEALAFDNRNIEILSLLCRCKLSQDKVQQGMEIAQNIAGINPEYAEGFALMAEASARSGNAIEAELHILEALRLDAQNVNYMTMLSSYLLMKHDEPAAVQMAANALKIDPGYVPALAALGTAKFELEDFDEALAAFHEGLELEPNNAILLHHIGRTLKEAGGATSAKAMFLDSLRNDPNFDAAALGAAGVSFSHNPLYKAHYYLLSLFKQSHITRLMFFSGAFLFCMILAEAAGEKFAGFAKVMAVGSWILLLILLSAFIIPPAAILLVVFKEQYSHVFNWQAKIKSVSVTLLYLLSVSFLILSICSNQPDANFLMYCSWSMLIATLLIHVLLSNRISAIGRLIAVLAAATLSVNIYFVSSGRVSFERIGSLYLYIVAASMAGAMLYPFRKLED